MQSRVLAMLVASIMVGAGPAEAQRLGYPQATSVQQNFPRPIYQNGGTFQPGRPIGPVAGQRWGGRIDGRWAGGYRAPGGWNAYRRPARGWTLPSYWVSPNFFVGNYGIYGLSTPPSGYRWSRYYDDAVLIDGNGRIFDTIGGVNWDIDQGGYAYDQSYQQSGYGYQGTSYQGQSGYGATYAQPGYVQPGYVQQTGQPTYGFQGTYQGTYTQAPGVVYAPQAEVVQPTYGQQYSGGYSGSYGYAGSTIVNGVAYPAGTTTTVTIQSAPVVTTTTTEYIEETVYRAPRRVYRKPVRRWRPAPRQCSCNCGCR